MFFHGDNLVELARRKFMDKESDEDMTRLDKAPKSEIVNDNVGEIMPNQMHHVCEQMRNRSYVIQGGP